ncbi:hypothetical protein Dxin01_01994 [Deinococcus xinjiangensis]|uniref:HD-GYP domain-containing protein n=1 Tax=Deinococcus xinjiangensis TaxID=457454 RepID=A0ABP9VC88_9DEIO
MNGAAAQQDPTQVLSELLARPSVEGIMENALLRSAHLLGGNINGFAVLRRGQDKVVAVYGYPRSLVGQNLSGPWTAQRPRILSDGAAELFEANSPDLQRQLDSAGMRGVPLSFVVPVGDRGRTVGALVLDRTSSEGISPTQQEAVTRWANALGPLIGMLEARDEWQQAARQITSAVVEAVESQEFEALGHAQAVAESSVRIGRAMNLTGRELEQLWFAATLHDLGKIHGEEGHPLVGANFLHAAPNLAEAQKAIRHHHERWDGQGEPDKLSGEDIPLYSRILAVANAYVRTGDLERVRAQAEKGLDPRVVLALETVLAKARG